MSDYILLRHRVIPDLHRLDVYLQQGGYQAFKTAVTTLTPQQVVETVKSSGLRGRGGAGFPTGLKWSFLAQAAFPRYVVANCDESEPGTFKDRELLERNPHQFLEGVMLAAYAAQANQAYCYLRGEFHGLAAQLDRHLAELRARGWLGRNLFGTAYALDIQTRLGAGAYICGEESALLESLEGRRGQPRLKPPFPADKGLRQQPTIINNVETLANVPPIIARGAAWYRTLGTAKSPGPKIFSLSGCVRRPGNYELPLGTSFRELIFTHGGGPLAGRTVKAILPSGASSCLLPATEAVLDCPMDYESVAQQNSALGSGSVIVVDDGVSMPWLTLKTARFFKHESCGKCAPCRLGTWQMLEILERLCQHAGQPDDLERLEALADTLQRGSFCPLGQTAPNPVLTALRHFRAEYEACLAGA